MSILDKPTDEYSMRHAANLLSNLARTNEGNISPSDLEVINFAYQQLHRGANTLRSAQAQAWDEGYKQGGPMHDGNMDDPDAHTHNPYRSEE